MSGGLTFHVLGPLEVRSPTGEPIDLRGPQPRLVLARLLAAEGRVVTADALLDTLWGTDPPDSASGTLQTYVSRLRRALGPDGPQLLRYQSSGYLLEVGAGQVDAHRFEQWAAEGSRLLGAGCPAEAAAVLRDALQLWRGDVLGDIDADFVRSVAGRWQERRLSALEDLYDAELGAGRATAVVADVTAAVGAAPLRERLRGLLALALYRSGRQADALAVLDEGRRLLGDELGLDLSRDLRTLQARILAQDPTLDLAGIDAASGAGSRTAVPGIVAADPGNGTPRRAAGGLIGRAEDMAVLQTVLAEVLAGDGCRQVLIDGEAGVGKTRLAQELIRHAESLGARALTAGTLESGAAPAYGPWLQLLREARQTAALPETVARLWDGAGQVLAGTAPTVVAAALADGVADTAVAVAAERGLVILLEDLQWADPASLDLLSGLGPRIGAAPVLIVATVRGLEVGRDDPVVDALAQITRQTGTRRLSLRGLSKEESGKLLADSTGRRLGSDVVAAVHARSDGNPFYTVELARMIAEQGDLDAVSVRSASVPTGVRDVLRRRVARLPAATGRLMEVAAVLGRQVDLALLATVADRDLDDCLDDLEPALLTRLLEVPPTAPGSVRFTHALVREALAEEMSSLRRARIHLRAADGILAAVGDNDDTVEIVAEHLWHAAAVGVSGRAAAALEAAAQVALKRQALVSAESLLERAVTLYRAANTEGGLAELRVLRQIGFVGAALHGYAVNANSALVRRAQELARSTDRLDILLDLIWADWAGCDTGGQRWRGLRLVAEAEALVRDVDDPLLQAAVASMRGFTERHFGRMTSSFECMERAVTLFAQAGETQEAGFYLNGYLTSRGFRHWAGALTRGLDREALEQEFLAQDLPFGRMVVSLAGAAATMAAGDHEGMTLFAQRMLAADPDMLLSVWSAAAELYTAVGMLQRREVTEGLALLSKGLEHMRLGGGRTMLAGIYAAAAQAMVAAGGLAEAHELVDRARAELAETGELAYLPVVELAAAHLALVEGDPVAAQRLFDRGAAIAAEQGSFGMVHRIEAERRVLDDVS